MAPLQGVVVVPGKPLASFACLASLGFHHIARCHLDGRSLISRFLHLLVHVFLYGPSPEMTWAGRFRYVASPLFHSLLPLHFWAEAALRGFN